MQDIISWLMDMEELAGNLYRGAALLFKDDASLSNFLDRLAEDEALHYHIISEAQKLLQEGEQPPASIKLDSDKKEKLEAPFTDSYGLLLAGNLTREKLLDCIVTTEFSEFNNVFLYVINTLKTKNKEFMNIESEMQRHLSEIEGYLESLPDGRKYIEKIHRIPISDGNDMPM